MARSLAPCRSVALLLLAITALALRLPQLQDVPHLTDETTEVLWAHRIAFAGHRPLTHTDSYDGPLWPYLLALAFRSFGSSIELPRAFALAIGLATIAATAWLAAVMAERERRLASSFLAGLLLATNFSHAIVASRVAWSNNSTPLWTTALAVTLIIACQRPRLAYFVVAGALAALALQSHPSAIVFLVGATFWYLLAAERRLGLRSPLPWSALGTALVVYSPVLVHNLRTGFSSLAEAAASTNTPTTLPHVHDYALGLAGVVLQLGRSLSGGYNLDGPLASWRPIAAIYGLVALGAVFLFAVRNRSAGRYLPATIVLTSVFGLPLFNSNWHGLLESRYLGFLWPLVAAAVANVATSLLIPLGADTREASGAIQGAASWRSHSLSQWAGGTALVLMMLVPALRVSWYLSAADREQYTNLRLRSMLAIVLQQQQCDAPALVDRDLKSVRWRAGGHPRRAMEYLLTLAGVPFERAPRSKINHWLAMGERRCLFLAGATADELSQRYVLLALDAVPRPREDRWGLYTSAQAMAQQGRRDYHQAH